MANPDPPIDILHIGAPITSRFFGIGCTKL